jgi:hypothetical protein
MCKLPESEDNSLTADELKEIGYALEGRTWHLSQVCMEIRLSGKQTEQALSLELYATEIDIVKNARVKVIRQQAALKTKGTAS